MLRYGITMTLEVPVDYAYAWLTDFRSEDPRIIGDPYPRHIIRKNKGSFLWIQHYERDGQEREGVRLVTLKPPNAWHNEALTDEKESILDYRLTRLGRDSTKLTIKVRVSFKARPEARADLERNLTRIWEKYKEALEKDFRSGKGPLD